MQQTTTKSYALSQLETNFESFTGPKRESILQNLTQGIPTSFKRKSSTIKKKKKKSDVQKSPIRVSVRFRPSKFSNFPTTEICLRNDKVRVHRFSDTQEFQVDSTLNERVTQPQMFRRTFQSLIYESFKGYNTAILALGGKTSGKTYTMFGTEKRPGVVFRSIDKLYDWAYEDCHSGSEYRFYLSMYELYQDQIFDLLDPSPRDLKIRVRKKLGTYIDNLSVFGMRNRIDMKNLVRKGLENRHVFGTKENEHASLGHVVCEAYITKMGRRRRSRFFKGERMSKITFADLAGNSIHADDDETSNSNNLTYASLSRIAASLPGRNKRKDEESNKALFRASKLTYLLKECFAGDCKTHVMLTINPCFAKLAESVSALRLACAFRKIKTSARKQNDRNLNILIDDMQKEINYLHETVEKLRFDADVRVKNAVEQTRSEEETKLKETFVEKARVLEKNHMDEMELREAKIQYLEHSIAAVERWKDYHELKIHDKKEDIDELEYKMIDLKVEHVKELNKQELEARKKQLQMARKITTYEDMLFKSKELVSEKERDIKKLANRVVKLENGENGSVTLKRENQNLKVRVKKLEHKKQVLKQAIQDLKVNYHKRLQDDKHLLDEKMKIIGEKREKMNNVKHRNKITDDFYQQITELTKEKDHYLAALRKVVLSSDVLNDSLKQVEESIDKSLDGGKNPLDMLNDMNADEPYSSDADYSGLKTDTLSDAESDDDEVFVPQEIEFFASDADKETII